MKRILMLLILVSFYQGVFSLEVAYIKEINVRPYEYAGAGFCDDAQNIVYGNVAFNIQDGTITKLGSYEERYHSINRFGYFLEYDKLNRKQFFLFSLLYGTKPISEEVIDSLASSNRMTLSFSYDEVTMHLYGNASIQKTDFKVAWDGNYFGIDFFSDENQIADMPIEMKYGLNASGGAELSYDLFTGFFHEFMYWEGKGDPYAWMAEDFKRSDTDPTYTRKLHVFNLIYNGSIEINTEIRETPSHDGKILGYLNEGESVKVSKAENYEKREGYQDYWYYVTADSYSGWCTGEFLLIEGDTWFDRLELRGPYVEWDDIPESEDILKKPLYGRVLLDTKLYELPEPYDLPIWGELEPLNNYPITGSAEKGSVVEVIDKEYYNLASGEGNNWYKVRLENGTEGWIVDDDIDIDLKGTKNLASLKIVDEIIDVERVNFESPERHGVVNDTQVRLRSNPSLDAEILEHLNTGIAVTIIGKTTEKYQIDNMDNYWYKVTAEGYPTGWIYGAFIDFAVDVEETAILVATKEVNTAIPWAIGGVALLLGAIVVIVIAKKKK